MSLMTTRKLAFVRTCLTKAGISTEAIDKQDEAAFIQALKGATAARPVAPAAKASPRPIAPVAKSSPANKPATAAPVADPHSLDSLEARFHGSEDTVERADLFPKLEFGFLAAIEAEKDPVAYKQLYSRLRRIEESYRN
jgi:hypothetical protein